MPFNRKKGQGSSKPAEGNGGLTITYPSHYQVVQRNLTTNKGTMTVRGCFTGNTNGIEARWNGGSWQTIDSDPKLGVFSGTLTNLTPGQGDLEVRFKDLTTNVRKKLTVGVGDVYILAGQSNCVGELTNFQTYSNTLKATFFSKGYKWKDGADPLHLNDTGADAIYGSIGANSSGGGYWLLLADLMMDSLGFPVAFVPCAKVGINITEFFPNASNHLDRTTLYGAMLYRTIQVGGARCVFWHQGETNVNDAQATYYSRLNTVADNFAADTLAYTGISTKFAPCKIQKHATNDYSNLWAATQQFWDNNVNAVIGGDLSGIQLTTTPPEDGLHLTTDAQGLAAAQAWHTAFTNNGFYV